MPEHHAPDETLVTLLKPIGVRAIISDVDGTLTDGSLATTSEGAVIRRFVAIDGMGHTILQQAGVQIAWCSATSERASIARRAEMLRIEHVDTGHGDKGPRFDALCRAMGVDASATLYIGDDINDLPAMDRARACFCPADAHPAVRARVDHILGAPGGHGAFRMLADAVVVALGGDPNSLH